MGIIPVSDLIVLSIVATAIVVITLVVCSFVKIKSQFNMFVFCITYCILIVIGAFEAISHFCIF